MDSPDPSQSLDVVWASKEAAYKLFARIGDNRGHFIPREFVLDSDGLGELTREGQMSVTHGGVEARVEVSIKKRWVHAIATFLGCGVVQWNVREIEQRFLDGRQARVESEAVRLLAGELLSKCGERDVVLKFEGRKPILSRKAGGQAGMGISLSHHGAFVGVAIAWPGGKASLDQRPSGRFLELSSRGAMCSTFTA
jgi:hypothetical protein